MISRKLVLQLYFLLLGQALFAQYFLPGFRTFSSKKTSILVLEDGSRVEGKIEHLDREESIIYGITLKDSTGNKHTFKPKVIKCMYLAPTVVDKVVKTYDFLYDATQWGKTDSDKDIIKKNYAYFEKVEVRTSPKKTRLLMMQLINPSFSNKIKVYFDPFARKTMRAGIAGITLAGGDAKSYYIKKGDSIAYRLQKKNYNKEAKSLYEDCPAMKVYEKGMNWYELEKHMFEHSRCQ
jgi:hypothetical protein